MPGVRISGIPCESGGDNPIKTNSRKGAGSFVSPARRREAAPGPLLANMADFGNTPHISAAEFEQMGFRFVIFPGVVLRAMIMAGEEMLGELKEKGTQREFLDQMMTRERQNELLDYQAYFEIEKKYIPGE